jgi:DNA-binding NtrC family response regulator
MPSLAIPAEETVPEAGGLSMIEPIEIESLEDVLVKTFFLDDQNELDKFIKGLEKRLIVSALDKVAGSQKDAANILRIKYTTLNMKIKRYGILSGRLRAQKDSDQETAFLLEPASLAASD